MIVFQQAALLPLSGQQVCVSTRPCHPQVVVIQAALLHHRLPLLIWPCALVMTGGAVMVRVTRSLLPLIPLGCLRLFLFCCAAQGLGSAAWSAQLGCRANSTAWMQPAAALVR